jgi:alpha-amylase
MSGVCLYFQVHQPRRLARYTVFDVGNSHDYEDESENKRILDRVAAKCYFPAGELLLSLIDEYRGDFKVSFSLSGSVLDQMERFRPDVLDLFQRLSHTGSVEFLNETDAHSLASLYSPDEFCEQVGIHRKRTEALFGQKAKTFRNTELIYSNAIAEAVEGMGYEAILAEGTEKVLSDRTPNCIYRPAGCKSIRLLLRNYRLSDDVAFRFSTTSWDGFPLTAEKFAQWISKVGDNEPLVNLFMDFETFGEHQWKETGIFDFLKALPGEVLRRSGRRFETPAEAAANYPPSDVFDSPDIISWADEERDATAWLGNAMQQDAARTIYGLENAIRETGDPSLLARWRMLQTSDHFYYMCTKWASDGDVHRYFNPCESPYAAYVHYMNIVDDLSKIISKPKKGEPS